MSSVEYEALPPSHGSVRDVREDDRRGGRAVRPLLASIVAPTYGRRTSLVRVLGALERQTAAPDVFEVVVVCDGDIDGSAALCRLIAARTPYLLRVVEQANSGPAAARDRGVAEANAPLIVFLDDDVVPSDTWLEAHLTAQEGQDARVAIGPMLPPDDVRLSLWAQWEEQQLLRQYDDMTAQRWAPTHRQFYTGNASVLKQHIVAAGGFNAAFKRAEDVELAHRLSERGLHFVFLPEARGWHYIQRSFESWLRIPSAYGAADVAMTRAGRPWMAPLVAHEFYERNVLIRALVLLCVGRPPIAALSCSVLGVFARLLGARGGGGLAYAACSLIFNVRYYDGFAEALGGRRLFLKLIQDESERKSGEATG